MNFILRRSIEVIILLAGQPAATYCQGFNKFDVGIQGGAFIYQGDLTPNTAGSFKTPGAGLMISADRFVNKSFSVRANLTFASIKADDAKYAEPTWRQQRNFNFHAGLAELSGVIVWNILKKNTKELKRTGLSPYLFGGVGVAFPGINRNAQNFNREFFADEPDVIAGLDADLAHRLPGALPVFPVGAGIKYSLTPSISLHAESTYRLTTTDYLDGFSKSANASKRDYYSGHTIGVSFKLGRNRYDCPVVPK